MSNKNGVKPRKFDTVETDTHKEPKAFRDNRKKLNRREKIVDFVKGENIAGKVVGNALDFALLFLPSKVAEVRQAVKSKITTNEEQVMPQRIKPFLTQKSTWEGVAAVAGAIGIVIYPAAIVEIVAGVFLIIGGIEVWKREAQDE